MVSVLRMTAVLGRTLHRPFSVYALGSCTPEVHGDAWIAPSASVMGRVEVHKDASVWFGATVRGDGEEAIVVGAESNVQDGSVLHSDAGAPLTIGKGVTIGHMVMLHGCTVGDNTLVGIGATVLNHTTIGKDCIIGEYSSIRGERRATRVQRCWGEDCEARPGRGDAWQACSLSGRETY